MYYVRLCSSDIHRFDVLFVGTRGMMREVLNALHTVQATGCFICALRGCRTIILLKRDDTNIAFACARIPSMNVYCCRHPTMPHAIRFLGEIYPRVCTAAAPYVPSWRRCRGEGNLQRTDLVIMTPPVHVLQTLYVCLLPDSGVVSTCRTCVWCVRVFLNLTQTQILDDYIFNNIFDVWGLDPPDRDIMLPSVYSRQAYARYFATRMSEACF